MAGMQSLWERKDIPMADQISISCRSVCVCIKKREIKRTVSGFTSLLWEAIRRTTDEKWIGGVHTHTKVRLSTWYNPLPPMIPISTARFISISNLDPKQIQSRFTLVVRHDKIFYFFCSKMGRGNCKWLGEYMGWRERKVLINRFLFFLLIKKQLWFETSIQNVTRRCPL